MQILFLKILLLVVGFNNNEIIQVTIEDKMLLNPDTYIWRINILSEAFPEGLEGMKFSPKEEVINRISKVGQVQFIEKPEEENHYEEEEGFSYIYVEAYGIETYKKLIKSLFMSAHCALIDTKSDSLAHYENHLIKQMIKQSENRANEIMKEKGKKEKRYLSYEEVKEIKEEELAVPQHDQKGGFEMLKEKFIEYDHEGYSLNRKGQIEVVKKIKVNWELY